MKILDSLRHHLPIVLSAIVLLLVGGASLIAKANVFVQLGGLIAALLTYILASFYHAYRSEQLGGSLSWARDADGRILTTLLVCATVIIILVALSVLLQAGHAKSAAGAATALLTIVLAWVFMNTAFAHHYAHLFVAGRQKGVETLIFPGSSEPVHADFIYFAYVVGMTFQVSDVAIQDASTRRLATIHGLAAFGFNIFVLAVAINIAASLFQ